MSNFIRAFRNAPGVRAAFTLWQNMSIQTPTSIADVARRRALQTLVAASCWLPDLNALARSSKNR